MSISNSNSSSTADNRLLDQQAYIRQQYEKQGELSDTNPHILGQAVAFPISKAADKLQDCQMCGKRKTAFTPAYWCNICITLWFLLGKECTRFCEALLESVEAMTLSAMERERLEWNLTHTERRADWGVFADYLRQNKPELIFEYDYFMTRPKESKK